MLLVPEREAPAADHGDSPSVGAALSTDIADLYSFMNMAADRVVLIQTVSSGADGASTFATDAAYVFNIISQDDLLAPTQTANHQVIVTFDATGASTAWVDGVFQVTGDASAQAGITGGGVKVFAGLRDDPFFFNQSGFLAVTDAVNTVAGDLDFDEFGCPDLPVATAGTLVGQLSTEPNGATAVDDFAGNNVLAIVVEVDADLVTSAGDILAVYAATNSIQ